MIAYDVQFSEPSGDPKPTIRADRGRAEAGNVVLATTEVDGGRHDRDPRRRRGASRTAAAARQLELSAPTPTVASGACPSRSKSSSRSRSRPRGSPRAARSSRRRRRRLDRLRRARRHGARARFVDVERRHFNPADVRGKVVVVGASAPSLRTCIDTSTTGDDLMPGPEIHANAIRPRSRLPAAPRARLAERAARSSCWR